MPQPTPSDVHINAPLTNISIAYLQDQNEFISDKVFPNLPVAKQSDSYFTYDKKQWFRTDAQPRGLSQESAGSGYTLGSESYNCEVKALHKDIDDQLRANTDAPLNMDRDATEFVTRGMLLRREKDWATRYFKTGLWTGTTTGTDIVPGVLWDVAGSVPIKDTRAQITEMKKLTGFKPNTWVLGEEVWGVLQDNADFLDRISVTQRKMVNTDLLASVLGIDRVMIAGAVEDTAGEGAAASMDFVFGKNCLLCYSAPRPSLLLPTAGYTFSWSGYLGAGGNGTRVSRFRIPQIKSDRVEGETAYDQKVVATDMGAFFNGVIS